MTGSSRRGGRFQGCGKCAILNQAGAELGEELIWNRESRSESLSDGLSAAVCGKLKELRISKEEAAVAGSMFLLLVRGGNVHAQCEGRYLMLHVFITL